MSHRVHLHTLCCRQKQSNFKHTTPRSYLHASSFSANCTARNDISESCVLVQTSELIVDWCLITNISVSEVLDMIHAAPRKISNINNVFSSTDFFQRSWEQKIKLAKTVQRKTIVTLQCLLSLREDFRWLNIKTRWQSAIANWNNTPIFNTFSTFGLQVEPAPGQKISKAFFENFRLITRLSFN